MSPLRRRRPPADEVYARMLTGIYLLPFNFRLDSPGAQRAAEKVRDAITESFPDADAEELFLRAMAHHHEVERELDVLEQQTGDEHAYSD